MPGESTRTSMPCSTRWSAGPIPESISSFGKSIAPADTITSRRASIRVVRPKALSVMSTPTARRSPSTFSTAIFLAHDPVRTVRLGRSRFGCR